MNGNLSINQHLVISLSSTVTDYMWLIICSTEQRSGAVSRGAWWSASRAGFTARWRGRLESIPDESRWCWSITITCRSLAVL